VFLAAAAEICDGVLKRSAVFLGAGGTLLPATFLSFDTALIKRIGNVPVQGEE
jgi:hypothetical protein